MLPFDFSIDLHCHPTYKPLGKSFNRQPGAPSSDPGDRTSMWHYNPPTVGDKLFNFLGGLTKFSQANLTAAAHGRVWVLVTSLGSIEKWFFNNKMGTKFFSDLAQNFATGLGDKRVDAIQGMNDYFADLDLEYRFLEARDNHPVTIDRKTYTYRIVHNFSELKEVMVANEKVVNDPEEGDDPITLALIPSIEGLHVLNCGLSGDCTPQDIINNVHRLKQHRHRPWFVTFSHHFYNELCGHSRSLGGVTAKNCDQSHGLSTGFTELGKKVLDLLLDNKDGKRIFIDVKHLSPQARNEFYQQRRTRYGNVPVIISHGACNGLPHFGAEKSAFPLLGDTMSRGEINFYDNEIIEMVRSQGILGLQLDERRIASEEKLKQTKNSVFRNRIMHYRSELLWNQVQYIAELLDHHGLPAWDNLAMGSDYDGIVDPLNAFWTLEEYSDLKQYLERHAHNYMKEKGHLLKNAFNKVEADVIVQNIFQNNAWRFFERWF
ncbi:hypothetical protein V9K67_09470 [Paraflavisolibacter sp. H34]|uniref:hypothetical protein n=1 Tax=Huijunlia imazamoxiresistens TaxID=3127457 RepID=UPI00301A35B2